MPTYCSFQDCGSQWPWPHVRPLSTQASTGKSSSVSCGVISPFSWVLVQRRFCCCPGGSQSCQMSRLGNLLWALESLQQCKNFLAIIVLQFVCHLLSGSMVGQWRPLPRWLIPKAMPLLPPESLSPQQVTADPCLWRRHSNTQRQVWLSLLWGVTAPCPQSCVHKVLFVPSEHL